MNECEETVIDDSLKREMRIDYLLSVAFRDCIHTNREQVDKDWA